jgi:hypothetical protein
MVVSLLGCRGGSQPPPPATAAASAAAPAAPPTVPTGVVVAFYGTVVPAGWVLCDGRTTASGVTTPDLRDRFVLGLDPATGAVGERGGSASHAHKGKTGEPREGDEDLESGEDEHAANDGHTHDVSVDPAQHIPPYVKLAYIMKE